MSDETLNTLSVDDLLKAMARALLSEDGRDDFHRLAAQHEASVHESLSRAAPDHSAE
jgi:hypothetical protein